MKTNELTGKALNWAVNHAEGLTDMLAPVNYCGKWEFGGPIIEREGIHVSMWMDESNVTATWWAHLTDAEAMCPDDYYHYKGPQGGGPTPLIAAMRCYVASKLGEDVSIPEELK
jgi:hypothetical protein